jgi:acyl-CoA hydrolase
MRGLSDRRAFDNPTELADAIIEKVGKTIVLALPLGLGKANHIANALYARAVTDRSIKLTIFTGLTLSVPSAKSGLEHRFLAPLVKRVFAGYPALDYATAIHANAVPPNIEINEFFFHAGQWLNSAYAQQHYISVNYSHALRCVLDRGVNVVAQLVAHDASRAYPYSLSCNPDLTVDLLKMRQRGELSFMFACQVNSELPFMAGEAAIASEEFDAVLDGAAYDFPLFAPPREPVSLGDYAAGLRAASLVPDGGTLQIGIGSLGDAVAKSLIIRHRNSSQFVDLLTALHATPGAHTSAFDLGLYGCSEMFVEGLLDLFDAGVLKREIGGGVLDAGFFLGSRRFYRELREMPDATREKFRMRSISYINELYGEEDEKRKTRTGARFINDTMMVTLLGDVVSDALEDGRVVSGVGGQYNFVAQAFALHDARSIIMLRAARPARGKVQSNIRWSYGHTTIPRHLRDIVVTEYGIADLRGKSDRDVIAAMLAISDSRFQDELLRQAKDSGKIERSFELPADVRDNTPEKIKAALKRFQDDGLLVPFPFDSDFSETECKLLPALQLLKSASGRQVLSFLMRGLFSACSDESSLKRLGLSLPSTLSERLYAALIRGALAQVV